tara:strand:+ start:11266 stop:11535 length:270 start_codon:yes stop_codon:yes gene_type:complete
MSTTSWTTSTEEQSQNWDENSSEITQSYTFSSAPTATTWVEIAGEVARGYVFDGTQVSNQQFLTNFGWNPIWETNIDYWDLLNRQWGDN